MSGPILITVGNLLRKTHNRLPLRRRRSIAAGSMAYTTNGSDQFALSQRSRPRAGNESNLRAQTPTSFEGFSELDSSIRTSPRGKRCPQVEARTVATPVTHMSRAFVKEDENDLAELPDRSISPHRNFGTEAGLWRLRPLSAVRGGAPRRNRQRRQRSRRRCFAWKSVTGERRSRARKSSNLFLPTKARHPSA
jgi:hypothetical protein